MASKTPKAEQWPPGTWPVVGHEWAVDILKAAVVGGRVSHAYLFAGPQSIGKTTLAMALAQTLLCERENRPCGECNPCRKVQKGVHPDLRIVEPGYGSEKPEKKEAKSLGIDVARALRGDAALTPFESPWKIFLVPGAEAMTPESQNALLKTLEEPPPAVVILLTAQHEESLLPTIVSRCQVFNLRPLATKEVIQALREHWEVEKEQAELLASLSGGKMGWALTALGDDTILATREERLEELLRLPRAGLVDRFVVTERWSRNPEAAIETLELWLGWWRDLLAVATGNGSSGAHNVDRRFILEDEGKRYSAAQITGFLSALERTLFQVERNANLRLALEVLLLDLPSAK